MAVRSCTVRGDGGSVCGVGLFDFSADVAGDWARSGGLKSIPPTVPLNYGYGPMNADQVVDKILSEARQEAQKILDEARAKVEATQEEMRRKLADFEKETEAMAAAAAEDKRQDAGPARMQSAGHAEGQNGLAGRGVPAG